MRGKRPTRRQKLAIEATGWNPNNWLVTKVHQHELELLHRHTGTKKVIPV